jgi:hypothetical protein
MLLKLEALGRPFFRNWCDAGFFVSLKKLFGFDVEDTGSRAGQVIYKGVPYGAAMCHSLFVGMGMLPLISITNMDGHSQTEKCQPWYVTVLLSARSPRYRGRFSVSWLILLSSIGM